VEGLIGEGSHMEEYCADTTVAGKDLSILIDFPVRIIAKDVVVDVYMHSVVGKMVIPKNGEDAINGIVTHRARIEKK
jgi:hypothetical protein